MSVLQEVKRLTKKLYFIILPVGRPVSMQNFRLNVYTVYLFWDIGTACIITQYGSTVYIGIAHGWSSIIAIHKFLLSVSISICPLRTSRYRTCKKVTACKILDECHMRYEIQVNMIFTDSSSSS